MKMLACVVSIGCALWLFGCDSDNRRGPELGTQIDRMGRSAVNTALNATFSADEAVEDAAEDAYNVAGADMFSLFTSAIQANLAIYDSLDTVCGNQFAAAPLSADRYAALAGVLADDQLYVNSDASTCTTYLAVEANATGIIPNADCGGRTPLYDTIDVTYSVLAIGALSGVGDGILADANPGHSATVFPWLAAP
jgi:hypothetical protein